MGKLTTHVLDTVHGTPARGLSITLYRITEGETRTPLMSVVTNADGRVDTPLLADDTLREGDFELVFEVRAYFEARSTACPFLNHVAVRFTISDATQTYHVPLLVSPWSYSTYRGS